MSLVHRRPSIRAVAVVLVISLILVLTPIAVSACEDCWPYYEVLIFRPYNWLSAGYQQGDWVWIRTENINNQFVDTRWYVMEAGDPGWWDQPDPCCPSGPWYVTSEGGLYLIW